MFILKNNIFVIISSLLPNTKKFSLRNCVAFSFQEDGNVEKQTKVGSRYKGNTRGNPSNGQSRNTSVPRTNEEYIAQVSEEVERRVTKKLSQEYSRTESRILGALTKLDEFLSNQQIHTHFETVPGIFRSTNVENQGTNEDDSQSDPHPEAGIFHGQTTQNLGPKDCRDMVTGVTGEIRHCRDMVTGVTGELRHCRDMVTGATEEIRNGHYMVKAV